MNEKEVSQTTLAHLSGLEQPRISRLANGQGFASVTDLEALLLAFTDGPERYMLAIAYIADQMPAELMKELDITLRSQQLKEPTYDLKTDHLVPKARRAIQFLLEHLVENPAVTDVLVDLAVALGWQDASSPDLKTDTVRKIVDSLTGKAPKKPVRYPGSPRSKNQP